MNTMTYAHRFLCTIYRVNLMGLCLLLSACDAYENKQLQLYIQQVKMTRLKPIVPVPQFKSAPSFTPLAKPPRRDPFKAVVKGQQHSTYAPSSQRPKQYLESIALDNLRFVGTLKHGARRWGLIRQPGGLVSSVKIGDYLGKHFGQIKQLEADAMHIEETWHIGGKWCKKKLTLKINLT